MALGGLVSSGGCPVHLFHVQILVGDMLRERSFTFLRRDGTGKECIAIRNHLPAVRIGVEDTGVAIQKIDLSQELISIHTLPRWKSVTYLLQTKSFGLGNTEIRENDTAKASSSPASDNNVR